MPVTAIKKIENRITCRRAALGRNYSYNEMSIHFFLNISKNLKSQN